jgi:hypothetical protein
LITQFDDFTSKAANFILLKNLGSLSAATLLNYYLSGDFSKIKKENLDYIRKKLSNCDDPEVKSRLANLFLISETLSEQNTSI